MLSFIFLHIIVCMLCVSCYCWWFKDTASIFLFQVIFRDIYGTYMRHFWTWWSVTNNQVAYLWLQELFPAFIWSIGTIEETMCHLLYWMFYAKPYAEHCHSRTGMVLYFYDLPCVHINHLGEQWYIPSHTRPFRAIYFTRCF